MCKVKTEEQANNNENGWKIVLFLFRVLLFSASESGINKITKHDGIMPGGGVIGRRL